MKKLALLLLVLIPILGMSQIEKTFNNVKIQDTAKVSRITPLPGRSGFFIDADTTTIGDRTLSGSQKLNVDGAVKVGATTNGTAGTIEYAGSDFWFHTSDGDSTALSDLVGGGGGGDGISDSDTNNIFYTRSSGDWVNVDDNSVSKLRNTNYYLPFWYADFFNAQNVKAANNANILVCGDSYCQHYGMALRNQAGVKYGWGGGYNSADIQLLPYGLITLGTRHMEGERGDWTTVVRLQTDEKNAHNRYLYSDTDGEQLKLTSRLFNQLRLNYEQFSGAGSFSVRIGNNGTPLTTVDCDGADSSIWITVDMAKLCNYPQDTVYIENLENNECHIYGYGLEHTYDYTDYGQSYNQENDRRQNGVEVHLWGDGGSVADEFINGKDTAYVGRDLRELDPSLFIFVTLDSDAEAEAFLANPLTAIEGIADFLTTIELLKPNMDILLLSPNDERNSIGYTERYQFDSLAKAHGWAYLDFNNLAGDFDYIQELEDGGAGFIDDSIHFNELGELLVWKELEKILFPGSSNYTDSPIFIEPIVMNDRIKFPNATSLYLNSGTTKYNYMDLKANNDCILGYNAGKNITPTAGLYATGFGYRALYNTTTGTYNTAFGPNALYTNTIGAYNCAFGGDALYKTNKTSSTQGSYNMAMGFRSLYNNTTGQKNAAIGYNALYTNSTGNYNVAIGHQSLYTSAGSNNTGIGYQSLYSTSSGGNNTGIGWGSGYTNSTATNCLYLGYYAGYHSNTSNRIFLDVVARASEAAELAGAPIYVNANETVANQYIYLNGGYIRYTLISAALTDGTPTDAELDSATGTTPATVGAGVTYRILDSNGTGLIYEVTSDGTNWQYSVKTIAL